MGRLRRVDVYAEAALFALIAFEGDEAHLPIWRIAAPGFGIRQGGALKAFDPGDEVGVASRLIAGVT